MAVARRPGGLAPALFCAYSISRSLQAHRCACTLLSQLKARPGLPSGPVLLQELKAKGTCEKHGRNMKQHKNATRLNHNAMYYSSTPRAMNGIKEPVRSPSMFAGRQPHDVCEGRTHIAAVRRPPPQPRPADSHVVASRDEERLRKSPPLRSAPAPVAGTCIPGRLLLERSHSSSRRSAPSLCCCSLVRPALPACPAAAQAAVEHQAEGDVECSDRAPCSTCVKVQALLHPHATQKGNSLCQGLIDNLSRSIELEHCSTQAAA